MTVLVQHGGLIAVSHLTHEDPDQPETESGEDHEAVPDEMEEAVASLLHNINNRHVSSFQKTKREDLLKVLLL